jgi:hypothetical protein
MNVSKAFRNYEHIWSAGTCHHFLKPYLRRLATKAVTSHRTPNNTCVCL